MNLFELFAKVVLDASEYENGVSKVIKSGESLGAKLKSGLATAGSMAAKGIGLVTGAATAAGGALLALEASTEEFRVAQGKLNTAFEAAGMSAGAAQEAYKGFYGILGDTDTATEASQLLSELVQSEQDVSKWTNIAAGVYGKFGDSIETAGFIEAINQTQKLGEVNGTLADALEFAGITTDEFNAQLAQCSTEAERNQLIMDTLNGIYGDAADAFYRNNEAVVKSRENQAQLDTVMAKLGGTVANVKNALISDFLPGITQVVGAFDDLINGVSGADQAFADGISSLVNVAVSKLPEFLDFGVKILTAIVSGIAQSMPTLVDTLLPALVDGFITLLDGFVSVLPDILTVLTAAIPEALGVLTDAIPEILPVLLEATGILISSLMTEVPAMLIAAFQASPIATTIAGLIAGLDLLSSVSGFVGGISEMIGGLSGLSGAFSAVVGVVKGAAGAFSGLFSILLANPIALVIAAVAALVAGIIYLWNTNEGFRDAVIAIWEAIKNAFATAVEFIKALFDGFVEFFAGVWEGIQGVFAGAAEFFSGIFTAAWEAIQSVWSVAVEFFAGIWEGIQSIFSVVASVLGSFFAAAWSAVQTAWSVAVSFFQSVWDGIQAVFSVVAEVLGGFFSAAWEAVKAIWSLAVAFFTEVWNGIQAVFSVVAEVLGGFFSAAWDAVQAVWGTAVDFFTEIWNGIQAVFSVVEQVIGGFFSAAWAAIESVWGLAVSFFQAIWDGIVNIFSGVADWFGDIFTQAWEAVKSAWDGVTDFFSGIWEGIIDVFSDTVSTFFDIGADIVRGLWDGIQSLADWLWNNVSGWVSDIWNGIKDFFDINSPSKKMSWIAKMLIYGMSDEIDKNGDIAVKSAESWSKDLEDAISLSPPDFPVGPYPGGTGYQTGNPWGRQGGDTYVTINSPVAVDAVQAAREWRKTAQRMAMSL